MSTAPAPSPEARPEPAPLRSAESRLSRHTRTVRARVGVSGWNLLVSSGADIGTKAVGLGSSVVLARALQPEGFGLYNAILAFMALGLAFGNLGLDRLLLRELSSNRGSLQLLVTARAVRYAVVPVAVAGMVGYALATDDHVLPWVVGGLALYPALASGLLVALFQARERFGVPARATLVGMLVNAVGIVACALARAPLAAYLASYAASEVARQLYLTRTARAFDWPAGGVAWSELRPMLRAAFPYAVLTVLGIVYLRIDLIMLEAMVGGREAGLYAGATRVLMVTNALPGLCLSVLFPRFVRLQETDPERSARLYLLAVRMMVWIGAVLAVGFALGATPVLGLLYGTAYVGGAGALRWLMAALLFMFWHAPNGTVLFSSNRLRLVVLISFVTAGFNIVTNFYAIPLWGAEGAAATTAASELLSFLLFTPIVCQRLHIQPWAYLRSAFTPGLSRADRHLLLDIPS